MIEQEQTENWTYLLLPERASELAAPGFSIRFLNEEDTPWFVGDALRPNKGSNTAPFQMLTPRGLRLALPHQMIATIPEHRACQISIEETGETAQLIFTGLRVPEHDGGWVKDLPAAAASKPEPLPEPPPPPEPAPLEPPVGATDPDKPAPDEIRTSDPQPQQPPRGTAPDAQYWKNSMLRTPALAALIAGCVGAALGWLAAFVFYGNAGSSNRETAPTIARLQQEIETFKRDPVREVVTGLQDPAYLMHIVSRDVSPNGKPLSEQLQQCRTQAEAADTGGNAAAQDPRNLDPKIAECLRNLAPRAGGSGRRDLEERRYWLATAVRAGDPEAANLLGLSYLAPAFSGEAGPLTVTGSVRGRVIAYKLFELEIALAVMAERGRNPVAARASIERLVRLIEGGAFPWVTPEARQVYVDHLNRP